MRRKVHRWACHLDVFFSLAAVQLTTWMPFASFCPACLTVLSAAVRYVSASALAADSAPALRSMAGKLSIIKDKTLRARFESAKTAEEVAALADEFVAAIKNDKCAPALSADLEPLQHQQRLQSLI